ncbi:MAG: hypothetical protein AAFP97_01695 [Pseudomonadota bacterium]
MIRELNETELLSVSGGTVVMPEGGPGQELGPDVPQPFEPRRDEELEDKLEELNPGRSYECYWGQDGKPDCTYVTPPPEPLPIPFEYPDGSKDVTT